MRELQLKFEGVLIRRRLGQARVARLPADRFELRGLNGDADGQQHVAARNQLAKFRVGEPASQNRLGGGASAAEKFARRFFALARIGGGEARDPGGGVGGRVRQGSVSELRAASSDAATAAPSSAATTARETRVGTCSHGSAIILPPMKISTAEIPALI